MRTGRIAERVAIELESRLRPDPPPLFAMHFNLPRISPHLRLRLRAFNAPELLVDVGLSAGSSLIVPVALAAPDFGKTQFTELTFSWWKSP